MIRNQMIQIVGFDDLCALLDNIPPLFSFNLTVKGGVAL